MLEVGKALNQKGVLCKKEELQLSIQKLDKIA